MLPPTLAAAAAAIVASYAPAVPQPQHPTAEPSLLIKTGQVVLPGVSGRIDHLAIDSGAGRLYVAAIGNGSVEAIDLKESTVAARTTGLSEPQGVAVIPGAGGAPARIAVTCGGDGTVRFLDAASLKEVARVQVGDDADNIRFDAAHSRLVVGARDGALGVVDPTSATKLFEVPLPAHPESFQLDAAGTRAWVNVPGGFVRGGGAVVAVDLEAKTTTATWKLGDAGRNFPLALDEAHHRLLVGCRRPARLLVLNTTDGSVAQSIECIGDADDVWCAAAQHRIYISGGDGAVDVLDAPDQGPIKPLGRVATVSGARTSLLSLDGKVLYVACPASGDRPASILIFRTEP